MLNFNAIPKGINTTPGTSATFSVPMTFVGDRDGGKMGWTNGQTDIWTDRLFSENIILDLFHITKQFYVKMYQFNVLWSD